MNDINIEQDTPESITALPAADKVNENKKLFVVFGSIFFVLTLIIFGGIYYYQKYYSTGGIYDEMGAMDKLLNQVKDSDYEDSLLESELESDDSGESSYSTMDPKMMIDAEIKALDEADFGINDNDYVDTSLNDLN